MTIGPVMLSDGALAPPIAACGSLLHVCEGAVISLRAGARLPSRHTEIDITSIGNDAHTLQDWICADLQPIGIGKGLKNARARAMTRCEFVVRLCYLGCMIPFATFSEADDVGDRNAERFSNSSLMHKPRSWSAGYQIDIARQQLDRALHELAAQTQLNLLCFPDEPIERKALALERGPLRARITADAALSQLLEGTGLTFEKVNAWTVLVVPER